MADRKMKILVVEDEAHIFSVLELKLKKGGMEAVRAEDGIQALNLARSIKPDLILLDIMLPGIDGFRVCRLLKFDENFKHIPIIMVSAKDTERDKKIGLEVGADRYVSKPFKWGDLQSAMNELIGE